MPLLGPLGSRNLLLLFPHMVCLSFGRMSGSATSRGLLRVAMPAEVCCEIVGWSLNRNLIWNLKSLMGNIWWNCWEDFSTCQKSTRNFGANFLKFRRVTIRGAQPSARLSEKICLSEGSAGVSPRVLRGSAGFCGGPRDFPRLFGGSDPMLVTLWNCWRISLLFFSQTFRAPPGYPGRLLTLFSLGFEGHTELFGPHPFAWKTLTCVCVCARKLRFKFRAFFFGNFFQQKGVAKAFSRKHFWFEACPVL